MPEETLSQFELRLPTFKGWAPDIDARDAGMDTFEELLGYDPLRIMGVLSKDFGSGNQYTQNEYPSDFTILGMKSMYVKALATEFEIVVGKTAAHKLKIFCRKFYNGSLVDKWVDLTEYYDGLTVSAVAGSTLTIVVSQSYAADYFKGFTIIGQGEQVMTCTASSQVDGTHQLLTISENILAASTRRLDPNADTTPGVWTYLSGASLFGMLDDGDMPFEYGIGRDLDAIELPGGSSAQACTIGFSNLTGTPDAAGYTRLYYRAYSTGRDDGTLVVDLMEGATVRGTVTRTVKFPGRNPWAEGFIQVANSAVTAHNDLAVRLTGTCTATSPLRVSWLKIVVDVTDDVTTVGIYRYPVMMVQKSHYENVGATPTINLSRGTNKISVGAISTAGVVLPPAQVLYVKDDFFSYKRSIDTLYLESARLDSSSLSRGINIYRASGASAEHRTIIIPTVDGYQFGDPIFNDVGTGGTYQIFVDWGLFNKRVTGLDVFHEWVPAAGNPAVSDGQRVYFKTTIPLTEDNTLWSETGAKRLYQQIVVAFNFNAVDAPADATLDQMRGAAYTNGALNWRYRVQATRQQKSIVAADDGDNLVRTTLYDSFGVHNDDVFAEVSKDNLGAQLIIPLSIPGELLGLEEMNGNLYCFKRTAVQITDLHTHKTVIYEIDCASKRGIKRTNAGIVFVGLHGVYLFPTYGGLPELMNTTFIETWRRLSASTKEAAIVEECRSISSIIISTVDGGGAHTLFIYNYANRHWWKRRFAVNPAWMSTKEDGTLEYTGGANILKWPDRTVYTDIDAAGALAGVVWEARSQWMNLDKPRLEKSLATIIAAFISNAVVDYKIDIYFDRYTATPFDTVYGQTINGFVNTPLDIKTPNSFREVQWRIRKIDSKTDLQASGQLDISELMFVGEVTSSSVQD